MCILDLAERCVLERHPAVAQACTPPRIAYISLLYHSVDFMLPTSFPSLHFGNKSVRAAYLCAVYFRVL